MRLLTRLLVALVLLAALSLLTSPVEVKQEEVPVSYGKECINGRLYWVYRNPIMGKPFETPVGDGEGKHVECSEG